jgi:integrase
MMNTTAQKAKTPKYLFKRGDQYYCVRSVPPRYRHKFNNQKQIWYSLRTTDLGEAINRLDVRTKQHDAIMSGELDSLKPVTFDDEVRRCESFSIVRKSSAEIKLEALEERFNTIADRLAVVLQINQPTAVDVAALAGVSDAPAMLLKDAFVILQEIDPTFTAHLRDWDAKQKIKKFDRAIEDFIERMGDIDILTIDEDVAEAYLLSITSDVVVAKKFGSEHGNRMISLVRQVIKPVLKSRFKKQFIHFDGLRVKLKIKDGGKRQAFTEAEVRLIYAALPGFDMSEEAKAIIHLAMITGCGPKELCWLTASDIRTSVKTPYIKIGPNELRGFVKSGDDRHRDLPIATDECVALLKRFPNGFEKFQADNGPSKLNKELNPFFSTITPGKSMYSARHRFDDLLKVAKVDLGIKAALSGHSLGGHLHYYGRSGNGYTLADKKEAILKALAASSKKEEHENEQ